MCWDKIRKFFSWNTTRAYLMSKLELSNISDSERELIKKHRADLIAIENAQKTLTKITNEFIITMDHKDPDGKEVVYFYDFIKEWANNGQPINGSSDDEREARLVRLIRQGIATNEPIEKLPEPIAIKPKDVFDELERVPDLMSMENIDQKMEILRMKESIIKHGNNYAKKEVIDMQLRLFNRKKYTGEVKEFYDQYENTTIGKVMDLVTKYGLVLKTSELFVPTFPDEAIMIMKAYSEATVALCGKHPIYYVIAEAAMFKKEYQRNDPILLVQSPFGNYFQILGAWDKEMILLEEL